MSQMLLVFLIGAFLKKYTAINIFIPFQGNNKLYVLPILFCWVVGLTKYYSQKKVFLLIEKYDEKPNFQKRIWGVISIMSIVVPILLLPILSKKYQ